jgi:hypothetical protein
MITLSRIYYIATGSLAIVLLLVTLLQTAITAISGCELIFSQADFADARELGQIPDNMPVCQQYIDLLPWLIAAVIAILMFATAIRFYRSDRASRGLVAIGAVAGVMVGAIPGLLLWSIADFYRLAVGPVEIILAVVPFTAGVAAAVATRWRHSNQVIANED